MFARGPTGTWTQTAQFTGSAAPQYGPFAAGIDLHGNRAVVTTAGNLNAGRNGIVYVYDYDPSTGDWSESARLTSPSDSTTGLLGRSVSLYDTRIAVAASTYFRGEPGSVHVFEQNPETQRWHESAHLPNIDAFFIELALHDTTLLVGENRAEPANTGVATIYTTTSSTQWHPTATLRPSSPYASGRFGTTVALNETWALVTGYAEQLGRDVNIDRVVHVFRRRLNSPWTQRTILDIGQVDFGTALALHNSMALISAVPNDGPHGVRRPPSLIVSPCIQARIPHRNDDPPHFSTQIDSPYAQ